MSRQARPRLHLPAGPLEKGLFFAGIVGIALQAGAILLYYGRLTGSVPIHFDAAGEADRFGGKETLLVLFGLTVMLFGGLTLLTRVPHIYNYPWRVTSTNAPAQYRNARTLLRWIAAIVAWTYGYLSWGSIRGALYGVPGIGPLFLPALLTVLFGTVGYYVMRGIRAR
jgi:hypothetical protein